MVKAVTTSLKFIALSSASVYARFKDLSPLVFPKKAFVRMSTTELMSLPDPAETSKANPNSSCERLTEPVT